MTQKQTLAQAGYEYIHFDKCRGLHLLKTQDGEYQWWAPNKNHASWGLIFRNTHLEFVSSANFFPQEPAKPRTVKVVKAGTTTPRILPNPTLPTSDLAPLREHIQQFQAIDRKAQALREFNALFGE